ncbi:hypothetical protein, partial [Escherichia coli]|uniref:hypothetical protein n=1 Tax=Escherichia coli TaxID=562 RepID=UPI00289CEA37
QDLGGIKLAALRLYCSPAGLILLRIYITDNQEKYHADCQYDPAHHRPAGVSVTDTTHCMREASA